VAVTLDGTTGRIYFDGVENYNTAYSSTPDSTNDPYNIGGLLNSQFYNGLEDDVRIYKRALSAAEVLQLYRLGQVKLKP
jgi:hypothetical protein